MQQAAAVLWVHAPQLALPVKNGTQKVCRHGATHGWRQPNLTGDGSA